MMVGVDVKKFDSGYFEGKIKKNSMFRQEAKELKAMLKIWPKHL